jgi:peptide/nickel transport system permease protein
MRDFLIARLAAFSGAILGAGLILVVLLDLLTGGVLFDPAAWANATSLATSPEPWRRLAVTLPLVFLALLVATLGLALGCARPPVLDRLVDAIAAALAVIPGFWLGLLLALGVGGILRWLPAGGFVPWDNPGGALASLILPAIALGLPQAGVLASRTRDLLAPTRHPDADPREAGPKLLHALSSLLAASFIALLTGALLVEAVFYLPGLGRLILGAAEQRDLATLRDGLFVLTLVAALGGLALSLLRLALDPELRR